MVRLYEKLYKGIKLDRFKCLTFILKSKIENLGYVFTSEGREGGKIG